MDDVDIRGITTAIARTGKYDLSSCNNLLVLNIFYILFTRRLYEKRNVY